tara:strand:+ start:160 stop:804 length:645 start_codon:yes stop_codon:yes gene_type:complete
MALGIASDTDFQNRIRTIVDREDTAYFSNDQLNEYIEMAVDEFLQQYYTIFEASQDARDKLEKMVRTETVSFASPFTVAVSTLNSSETDPIYYRLLSARLTNSPTTSVKIIQIADYSAYLNDPFNKADNNNPVIYEEGGSLKVLGLTSTTSIDLTYLQYSNDYTDLPGHTYEEIAQIAARKILQTLGDPRYQLMQAEVLERNTVLGGGSPKRSK